MSIFAHRIEKTPPHNHPLIDDLHSTTVFLQSLEAESVWLPGHYGRVSGAGPPLREKVKFCMQRSMKKEQRDLKKEESMDKEHELKSGYKDRNQGNGHRAHPSWKDKNL